VRPAAGAMGATDGTATTRQPAASAAATPVAVSSITAAFIAQLITIGVAETMQARGKTPPVYLSANIPGGEAHNRVLEDVYGNRIRREA